MKNNLSFNIKKMAALSLCLYLFITLNPPFLRLFPVQTLFNYISIILIVFVTSAMGSRDMLYLTRTGIFLSFLTLLMSVHFSIADSQSPFQVKMFLFFVPMFFLPAFPKDIFHQGFRYFRNLMVFFAVCSIILVLLFLFYPVESLPYVELEPISAAHLARNAIYKLYGGFLVTYDHIVFRIGDYALLRACGPFTEPGHFGVFLGLTLCIELLLYSKRSPVLIICGLLTFSTAFYVILFLMEIYIIFVSREINWKVYIPVLLLLIIVIFIVMDDELREQLYHLAIGRNLGGDHFLDDRTNARSLRLYSEIFEEPFHIWWTGYGVFALEMKGFVLADYREFFYDTGIYGFLLVFTMIATIMAKSGKKLFLLLAPVIVIVFLHRTWMFWYPYIYIFTLIGVNAYSFKIKQILPDLNG